MKNTNRNEMNTKIFWEIIKIGREAADAHNGEFYDKLDKMHASVKKQLKKFTPEAIYKWYEIFDKKEDDLYDADLWFITGGSDDGFAYARRWIISKGERVYRAIKKNPKAISDVAPDYYCTSFESLPYAAIEAYDEVAGSSFYDYQDKQWQLQIEKRKKDNPNEEELVWDKSDNIITHRFNRLVKDSDNGDAEAQFDLASTYAHGWGIDQDDKKAIHWLTKAAEQGFLRAQIRLALCYSDGDHVKQNYEKAVFWYEKAAELGDDFAQSMLGIFYSGGDIPEDKEKAVYWITKASEQGVAFSQNMMGNCYTHGYGVPQDDKLAVFWWKKAAKQGNDAAQNSLGVCYSDGIGVRKNKKKAAELILKAALQGNASAQLNVGCDFENDGDTKQAIFWWTKSAEQDYVDAQMILGYTFLNGNGVRVNKKKAYYWFEKAAEQGCEDAIEIVKERE